LDSRFNFRGSGKQGTCFQICLKQLRKALEIQGAIFDFNLFWTAVVSPDNIIEVKERLHEVYDDSEEEA